MQLVINTFGTSLRRKGERFIISTRGQDRLVQLSAGKVHSIVIASGVSLTSQAIHLAAENNIDIVFDILRSDREKRTLATRRSFSRLNR